MSTLDTTSIFKKRLYAFGADTTVLYLFNKGIIFSYIHYIKSYFLVEKFIPESKINFYADGLSPLIFLCVFSGYFTMAHYIGGGQTVGKIIFGVKIISTRHEKSIDLMQSLSIMFTYYLNLLTFGLLLFLKDKKTKASLIDNLIRIQIVDIQYQENENNLYQLPAKGYDSRAK